MVGGSPGLGGGPPLPPTIHELDSQGINETVKLAYAIVKDSVEGGIPFTVRDYDAKFKYRSEPERPLLRPVLFLRSSTPRMDIAEDNSWKGIYQGLVDALPPRIREGLLMEMSKPFNERDPGYVALHSVMETVARFLVWLEASSDTQRLTETELAKQYLFETLSAVALRGSCRQIAHVAGMAAWFVSHLREEIAGGELHTHLFTELKDTAALLQSLAGKITHGKADLAVREGFNDAANRLDELRRNVQSAFPNGKLHILLDQLQAASFVAKAWSLEEGSSSLLLATMLATRGIETDQSSTGALGSGYQTVVLTLVGSILHAFPFGPAVEAEEIEDAYNRLANLD